MSKTDNEELNDILKKAEAGIAGNRINKYQNAFPNSDAQELLQAVEEKQSEDKKFDNKPIQWSSSNGSVFLPTGNTSPELIPGVYEIGANNQIGLYFEKIPVKTEGLIEFPEANTKKVTSEIAKFWDSEKIFRDYKLTYKRGILLYGPPGGGKSCTLQFINQDVISRGGIVIKYGSPSLFNQGLRLLRKIQPDIPVVVMMEDIDSIIEYYNETEVINTLDGVYEMDKIVFLATTNYPEKLGFRIVNRPSRFDKRFKVGYPIEETRRIYLNFLNKDLPQETIDKWASETNGFSISHLKELFIAVVVLKDKYEDALETLKSMSEIVSSDNDKGQKKMGFGHNGDDEF
jgi:DNA replication protein DnaC